MRLSRAKVRIGRTADLTPWLHRTVELSGASVEMTRLQKIESEKQIPFGDDRKKSESDGGTALELIEANARANADSLRE